MTDPWRYTCPDGHRSWEYRATREQYWCHRCESYFAELVDQKLAAATE